MTGISPFQASGRSCDLSAYYGRADIQSITSASEKISSHTEALRFASLQLLTVSDEPHFAAGVLRPNT